MKKFISFLLGFGCIILFGWFILSFQSFLLQSLFLACVVFAVFYLWVKERTLAVGMLTGVTFPLWGGALLLLGVWVSIWASRIPTWNVVKKIEYYKQTNDRYPESLLKIGVQSQIKDGFSYSYYSDFATFRICQIYDALHTRGPGVAGQCYNSTTKKWEQYSDTKAHENARHVDK